ncbi:hypothetical protein ACAG26_11645 [Mycobacterium sp. pUA109]|uniref:hypothetical protein n=1 Tax=Mycobacterium sp. pUA109 TaxID=3238982 RepID=UPI00351AB97C
MSACERALRGARLLSGPSPRGHYGTWLANAERRGVAPDVVVDIARRHRIGPDSFAVLAGMAVVTDPDSKSYFVIPPGTDGDDARRAVWLTYLLNAGTGYAKAAVRDFPETPYAVAEARRISDRQRANRWSYRVIARTGASLVATPAGILMGIGGTRVQGLFSRQGGTTWGDVFLLNIGPGADPARLLRDVVESGVVWYHGGDGQPHPGRLDLDRLLHHEERHCRQWAALGPLRMSAAYLAAEARARMFGGMNRFECDAGLGDGGYR